MTVGGVRMGFGTFVDKGFMAAMTIIATIATNKLNTMSDNIQNLNVQMAKIIERSTFQDKAIERLETRVQRLESSAEVKRRREG